MDTRAHKAFFAASAAAFVAACSLVVPDLGPPVPGRAGIFPHDVHAGEDAGMACADCHAGAETAVRAGMPALEDCFACHDSEVDDSMPLAQQPVGFILPGDQAATWSSVTGYPFESGFSHVVHADAGADCELCHAGVADSDATDWDWKVTMTECQSCHDADGSDIGGCVACHESLDRDSRPSNHEDLNWDRQHGVLGAMGAACEAATAQDCALCHTESSCDNCHAQTLPMDHSEAWRQRGHGFSAALERDRCDTCHREDSCVRCHQTVTPITHSGIWGGGTSAHCGSCHIPLGADNGCTTCHRGTPSHRLATSIPGGTHPGSSSDCRSCHTPLDHFDNGQACTLCHR